MPLSEREKQDPFYQEALQHLQENRPHDAEQIADTVINLMEEVIDKKNKSVLFDYLDVHPDIDDILTGSLLIKGRESTFLTIVRQIIKARPPKPNGNQ